MHHAYSDTENDPHSPAHVGWWKVLTTTWNIKRIPSRFSKDLFNNQKLVFCHNHWGKVLLAVWIISFIINPMFFVGFALIPFLHAKIGFGLLNTLGHAHGPSNNVWLNLLVAGEGYHLEHHKNSKAIRLHRYDSAGWIIEQFLKLGIFKLP
jgi:stearoyl-CoA desaturase (delta-9 desaturase)